ncbi:MAG: DUF480 domain-containing protein [Planctomycetes bacterium]|nr:DUF480 domain-containing protein [Planctomycetota bacterium]
MPALELDGIEARLLGVLIEKEFTTPEQYPLSLNALLAGANQKSNRAPVLELGEAEIAAAIERLRRKSLVGASHASGSRTERYKHAAGVVWSLTPGELAVLAELFLRGAQMPGELRGRADRMSRFETLEALSTTLEALRQKGFVQRLEPLPGARAPQWDQIVAGREAAPLLRPVSHPTSTPTTSAAATAPAPLAARPESAPLAANPLEKRVAVLEAEVARLAKLYEDLAR